MTPIRLLQKEEQRIVDTLGNRTPPLLAMLTTAVEHDAMPRAHPRRTPPTPPATLGLLEPPEPPRFDFTVPLGVRATEAIHTDLQTELKDIRSRILRQHDDLYKLTTAGAAVNAVTVNGGTITDAQRSMMADLLVHGVTGFTDSAGRRHLLVIEEAHCLPHATLKHLKRFAELKDGLQRLVGVALIAQPELARTLESMNAEIREVAQRCEVVWLEPLDNELEAYLRHKFARFDLKYEDVFEKDAADAIRARLIHRPRGSSQVVSLCFPLAVHNLVCRAMNVAADVGWPKVDAQAVAGC